MSTYLDLVNKVLQESNSEMEDLTSGTWSSAEAGRRLYPRVKRNVRDAWKKIQMKRDSWEFMTGELSAVIYPRIRFSDGDRPTTPAATATYVGDESGAVVTLRDVLVDDGAFSAGTAEGQLELSDTTSTRLIVGETFTEVTPSVGVGSFTYLGKGDYSFAEIQPRIGDIHWATFVAAVGTSAPKPLYYVPWDHWSFEEFGYTTPSVVAPVYVTQNYNGRVAFYPQAFEPFRVSFVHALTPQILSAWDDEPEGLPEAYHDWIAWEALKMMALSDKNPTLYKYGDDNATQYMLRAEKNLLPLMTYRPSPFNV
jgi:hypothetical protein